MGGSASRYLDRYVCDVILLDDWCRPIAPRVRRGRFDGGKKITEVLPETTGTAFGGPLNAHLTTATISTSDKDGFTFNNATGRFVYDKRRGVVCTWDERDCSIEVPDVVKITFTARHVSFFSTYGMLSTFHAYEMTEECKRDHLVRTKRRFRTWKEWVLDTWPALGAWYAAQFPPRSLVVDDSLWMMPAEVAGVVWDYVC